MLVERLVVGMLQTNCYIVADESTKEGIVIDPGGSPNDILKKIEEMKLKIIYVINTHGHFDHIMANKEVVKATGASLAIHPDDEPMLRKGGGLILLGLIASSPPPDVLLNEGDVITFGKSSLRVIHTPGHSPGSISLYSEADGILFCGDVLFNMGIGRSDFPGGNHKVLMESIRTKLLTLPDETIVYPGHGPPTSVGQEKLHNPFLH
ncbi:MAG: MBL fold metallo-hydrolase [Chloroflexi bacterium]|nr:MAG: MBL fold metallo-hydrolase [Chloroflexota bacterium]HDN79653.1 MBL fold metallo-hydrolase [Chloroflexota bacterium]